MPYFLRSRTMADKTLLHVLTELLQYGSQTDAYLIVTNNRVYSAYDLCAINSAVLTTWSYDKVDSNGGVETVYLHPSEIQMILIVCDFLRYLFNLNAGNETLEGTLTEEAILKSTRKEFDYFRINPNYVPRNVKTNTYVNTTPTVHLELTAFQRKTKLDITQYPELKDERMFENWKRSFLAVARSHHIDKVFDPDYTPSTPDDKALFAEKQLFAYTVLDQKLLTNMGKSIVRSHADTGDAQKVWKEFDSYCKKSAKAAISSSALLSWICSAKYDKNWNSTSLNFLLYFEQQIKEYDSYQSSRNKLNSQYKLNLLMTAVNDVPELRAVRNTAEMIYAAQLASVDPTKTTDSPKPMTYEQYVPLLRAAMDLYDAKYSGQAVHPKKQAVFHTDILNTDEMEEYIPSDHFDDTHDVDTGFDIDTLLVNLNQRKPPIQAKKQRAFQNVSSKPMPSHYNRPYIPPDIWKQLPPEAQKAIVNVSSPSGASDSKCSANMVSFLEPPSDAFEQVTLDVDQPNANSSGDDINVLLNHMSNRQLLQPAEIDPRLAYAANTGIRKPGEPRSTSSNSAPDEIQLHGARYRKINVAQIIYQISNKKVSYDGYALVDRGANGGVLGSDALVLEKTGCTVNIVGVGIHEISQIPICTGAAYTRTQHGPVIIIMHQYACLGHGKTI